MPIVSSWVLALFAATPMPPQNVLVCWDLLLLGTPSRRELSLERCAGGRPRDRDTGSGSDDAAGAPALFARPRAARDGSCGSGASRTPRPRRWARRRSATWCCCASAWSCCASARNASATPPTASTRSAASARPGSPRRRRTCARGSSRARSARSRSAPPPGGTGATGRVKNARSRVCLRAPPARSRGSAPCFRRTRARRSEFCCYSTNDANDHSCSQFHKLTTHTKKRKRVTSGTTRRRSGRRPCPCWAAASTRTRP